MINIKANFYTPDGVVRNVELVSEFERTPVFTLTPAEMSSADSFKKFCFSKGNFIFEGSSSDLMEIWKYEFLRDSGKLIYMPDRIGRLDNDIWLFGNMAIKDGKEYHPDNDGVIWVDGEGYKPQGFFVASTGTTIESNIPSLSTSDVDIVEISEKLYHSIGGYEAYIGVGWALATIFSQDIFNVYKSFPILFAFGRRSSGKSTYLRWIMNLMGMETEGVGLKDTTNNFIVRALSYYGSLGVWLDEYRNDTYITQKDGLFRSAWNRQVSGKGTNTSYQARGFIVNGTLTLSGEESPKDNGLFTRCIMAQLTAQKRNREHYDWLNRNSVNFSNVMYKLLLNYDENRKKVLQAIAMLRAKFLERKITDRTAENWAIAAATFYVLVKPDNDFIKWVEQRCQEIKKTGEEEHMLNEFWNDVSFLVSKGKITKDYIKVDDGFMYCWFRGMYDEFSIHYRQKTGKQIGRAHV